MTRLMSGTRNLARQSAALLILWAGITAAWPHSLKAEPPADAGVERIDPPKLASAAPEDLSALLQRRAAQALAAAWNWHQRTPAGERVVWGGLAACVILGVCVTLERMVGLRIRAVVPRDFTARFLDRLHEGKLDGGKALDYCEMNPSPAARVALAAVRRWGRPATELERAVDLAHRWESERLKRNVGTLRRIALLAPLLGFLGTLLILSRLAAEAGAALPSGGDWAEALRPLIFGVGLGAVSLVIFDLAATRVERLGGALDRLGAETIDAIAMTTTAPRPAFPPAPHTRIEVARLDPGSVAPDRLSRRK